MQTVLNQLIYFGFLQSILLIVIYAFVPQKRKNINPYLLVLVIALAIGLLGRIIYTSEVFGKSYKFLTMSEIASTLFGPTLYLFVKSSLNKHKISKRDLIKYIPSLAYSLSVFFYFVLPEKLIHSNELARVIFLFLAASLLINFTFWILSIIELNIFKKKMNDELSYSLNTKFLSQLITIMGIIFFIWLGFYLASVFENNVLIERTARTFIWMSLAFITLFITSYGMVSPNAFKISPIEITKKYAQSKLSNNDLDTLKVKLEVIMEEKKPYLNNKLLKAELAELVGISNPELARLLNERIGMNFFEYINYHRIQEFIKLAKSEKGKQLTFFGLAQEAGFNSKATFYNAFKKITGSSPTSYFNDLKS